MKKRDKIMRENNIQMDEENMKKKLGKLWKGELEDKTRTRGEDAAETYRSMTTKHEKNEKLVRRG